MKDFSPQQITVFTTVIAVIVVPVVAMISKWIWRELQEARTARLLKVFASRIEMSDRLKEIENKREVHHNENKDGLNTIRLEIRMMNESMERKFNKVDHELGVVHDRVDKLMMRGARSEWNGVERRGKPRPPRA